VGRTKIPSKDGTTVCTCKYSDVPVDLNGWVANLNYFPIGFDMCQLSIKNKEKPISGWWDERKWTGLRFKKGYKVLQWKRMPDYD
jgi:hypothetical protein